MGTHNDSIDIDSLPRYLLTMSLQARQLRVPVHAIATRLARIAALRSCGVQTMRRSNYRYSMSGGGRPVVRNLMFRQNCPLILRYTAKMAPCTACSSLTGFDTVVLVALRLSSSLCDECAVAADVPK